MPDPDSRLVYSTDGKRVVPAPGEPPRRAKPRAATPPALPDDGIVRVHRAKSPKGGKTMSAISGLPGRETDLDTLLRRLKSTLGTGGSREGRMLLVQGDHRERLVQELEALGFKVKLAGG